MVAAPSAPKWLLSCSEIKLSRNGSGKRCVIRNENCSAAVKKEGHHRGWNVAHELEVTWFISALGHCLQCLWYIEDFFFFNSPPQPPHTPHFTLLPLLKADQLEAITLNCLPPTSVCIHTSTRSTAYILQHQLFHANDSVLGIQWWWMWGHWL